ncbi:MAG: DNA gyrase inhibitor YacG [Sandaracinaceae bacterium]
MPACSICRTSVDPPSENPYWPFCSNRCRTIDLGNWLGGSYRMDDTAPPVPMPRTLKRDRADES